MSSRLNLDDWLASAIADAERRGLPDLKPLLETLAGSTAGLRRADATLALRERFAAHDPQPSKDGAA
jgi:hypothetical protein